MLRKLTAFILAGIMITGVFTRLCGYTALADPGAAYTADGRASDSAYAVDSSDGVYTVDNGVISLNGEAVLADNAEAIALSGDGKTLYYSCSGSIKAYDIQSGVVSLVGAAGGNIACFSLLENEIYVLDSYSLSKLGGEALLERENVLYVAKEAHLWSSVSMSECLFFSVISSGSFALFFANPDYDPENAYEENDQYLTYEYKVGRETLTVYNPYTLSDGSLDSYQLNAGTSYEIGNASFPLEEYPVGSFFTKNGKSCTCHNKGICVAAHASAGCNCMRYIPSESNPKYDLLSSQCWGFAEYCELQAYGYFDKSSSSRFCNAFGSKLTTGRWTASSVKETFLEYGAGGHLRVGGHSLFVISVSATGFITYECNKSYSGNYCVIYTNSWTWDSFYTTRKASDLLWYYVPTGAADAPIIDTTRTAGNYQVKATTLNLRSGASTDYDIIGQIPNNSIIYISEIDRSDNWGKTVYDGVTGWVSLDYVFFLTSNITGINVESPPDKTTYYVDDDFSTEGLTVYATFIDGTTSEVSGYTCSGYDMTRVGDYKVSVKYKGFTSSFDITVELNEIYPDTISLDVNSLTLLNKDGYSLIHTILPLNANMLSLVWASSDPEVATVENGVIETHKPGVAVISVTTANNLTASCAVDVVNMPEGTAWSVGADGKALKLLPLGITPLDYSVRYCFVTNGKYGEWNYISVGQELPSGLSDKDVRYQYRAITASFISDGKDAITPVAVDIDTYINLEKYQISRDGYLFAGWFKTQNAANALDTSGAYAKKVLVNGDLSFYAGWIELDKLTGDGSDPLSAAGQRFDSFGFAGAELALDEGVGIRFYSRISTSLITMLDKLYNSCTYGTVVIEKSALKNAQLVIKGSDKFLYNGNAVNVVAYNSYATYGDYIVYNALVTGYTDEYLAVDFAARPYVSYRDANGISHTYYYTCLGADTTGGAYYTNLAELARNYKSSDNVQMLWIRENILAKLE